MYKQTSREAFEKYKRGGHAMQRDYERIVRCLALNPKGFTRNEIAAITAIPINRITARVNELIEDGHLKTQGQRASQTTGHMGEVVKLELLKTHK